MLELSAAATTAWRTAVIEAWEDKHEHLEKEHLFIGALSLGKVLDAASGDDRFDKKILQEIRTEFVAMSVAMVSFGIDLTQMRREVREHFGKGSFQHEEKIIHRSKECKQMFKEAEIVAGTSSNISVLHLVAAILGNPGKIISASLARIEIKPSELKKKVIACSGSSPSVTKEKKENKWTKKSHLERFGRDLNNDAKNGKLGPFIGRQKEILHTIQTLARSSKNNPVLVGEPGVGKTAIAEAIALSIEEGTAPPIIEGKRIIEINMGVLLGGTKHRGEFEERLTKIIEEVKNDNSLILFIDEIHSLIGSGRGDGTIDAANIMKPALARGEFRCMGATTIEEYRRFIESDAALERRFDKIVINEPSRDEAVEILQGIKGELEMHHQIIISELAIERAVDLSIRFDGDHQLPDKAIDILDQAGARAQIPMLKTISDMKDDELDDSSIPEITDEAIVEELALKTGIPAGIISGHFDGNFSGRLRSLEASLNQFIKGQAEAISKICNRLFIAYAGLRARQGPLAVYLFLGPSGVGKTETAKKLAENLFGSAADMIRLDMSEYMQEHSVSKLLGSPPGYVGYKEEGQLIKKLRSKPYSIVLLDEVEKAHPKVFDIFLQVFDEGRLTDSKGRTIDAKNAIFVLTTNIGGSEISSSKSVGFLKEDAKKSDSETSSELGLFFRTELLNRIDEQIVFNKLEREDIKEILKPMVIEISTNLREKHQVEVELSTEAENYLAEKGYSETFGARELSRTLEEMLQSPLSSLIIEGRINDHACWHATIKNDSIVLSGS